jgi:hypothetical protein
VVGFFIVANWGSKREEVTMDVRWTPCRGKSDKRMPVVGEDEDGERRWIREHPVVYAQGCVVQLRFESLEQLINILAELALMRGPISSVSVLRHPRSDYATLPFGDGPAERWFSEGCALVILRKVLQEDWE